MRMTFRLPSIPLRLLLLVVGSVNLSTKIDALRPVEKSLFVVFGRPGSGKTTVANEAFDILSDKFKSSNDKKIECLALDLDVCVTQLMRDNFGKGIYPTLEERKVFAQDACKYVDEQVMDVCSREQGAPDLLCILVSFSFVNTDLRDIFRAHFPEAEWILIDTPEEECTKRINEREGHFYKGEIPAEVPDERDGSPIIEDDDKDNSDWKFASVTFPHLILDGQSSIDDNANKVVEKILKDTQSD